MNEAEGTECDVLVVGSGCGGLAAAVTAGAHGHRAIVVEKEKVFGGTTARSGGWLWIPGTALAPEGKDSIAAARTYLQHEAGNRFDAERVDAFLENGAKAVAFFTTRTALRFECPTVFPDYHAEAPGGALGGRSMVTEPFDGRALGEHLEDLGPALPELTVLGMMLGSGKEIVHFMRATRSLESFAHVTKRLGRHFLDVARHGRGMRLTNGNALVGRLAKSAFDLGIPLWLDAPVRQLIHEAGAVRGAAVERDGRPVRVSARHGVVLACGGFPHDPERRKGLFPHAPTGAEHCSPAPQGNTGDGLRLAEAVGGRVDSGLPNAAAWVPVSEVRRRDGTVGVMPHFIDRAKPGVIAVTRAGKRFANEANSYHDFVQALVEATRGASEICAFLLADHRSLRRYGLGFVKPFPLPLARHLRSGYLLRGRTLGELAHVAGIDAAALAETVERFNRDAGEGRDAAFGKGSTAYNRHMGDALHRPNPCLAPLATPPYYAVKLVIGDLGTFAGLATDRHARVLGEDRRPIPGLYAVGNDAQSIMGGNYPGAGITLGPALTFGYIAGMHLVETAAERDTTPIRQSA